MKPHIFLDKKAQQLLKNLLDDAAERIWKVCLEVYSTMAVNLFAMSYLLSVSLAD